MATIVTVSGHLLEIKEYEYERNTRGFRKIRKATSFKRDKRLFVYSPFAIKRKTKEFYRLVQSNLIGIIPPAFFTLTMYESCSIKSSYEAFTVFIQRLRKSYGKDFRYITVPEYQKRGAVHFHMMIWGLPEFDIKHERFNRKFQNMWQEGYLDCILTDGSQKLAGYLGKYMSKSLQDSRLYSQKSYRASGNILRSVRIPFKTAVGFSKEIWGVDLSTDVPLCDFETMGQWTGKGRYRAYHINL